MRTLRIRVTVIALVVAALFVAGAFVFFVKIDAKFSATQSTVGKIRSTQIDNITRNDAISTCEVNDFNAAFRALALGFAHDNNPADYPKAQVCTATLPKAPKK